MAYSRAGVDISIRTSFPPSRDGLTMISMASFISSSAGHLVRKNDTKSWVRNHFHVYANNSNLAKCDMCKEDIKWGSSEWGTSTICLTAHLISMHRDVYDAALAALAAAADKLRQVQMVNCWQIANGVRSGGEARQLDSDNSIQYSL